MSLNPFHSWLSKPAAQSIILQEAPREHFEQAREAVMAELEIATVDASGRRLKEREVRTALRVVAKL